MTNKFLLFIDLNQCDNHDDPLPQDQELISKFKEVFDWQKECAKRDFEELVKPNETSYGLFTPPKFEYGVKFKDPKSCPCGKASYDCDFSFGGGYYAHGLSLHYLESHWDQIPLERLAEVTAFVTKRCPRTRDRQPPKETNRERDRDAPEYKILRRPEICDLGGSYSRLLAPAICTGCGDFRDITIPELKVVGDIFDNDTRTWTVTYSFEPTFYVCRKCSNKIVKVRY